MATSPTVFAPQKSLEDPLAHLPCSSIVEYKKGQMIYNQDQPSTNIYLIIAGKIKVSRVADDGHQVVVDIYQPDEFFGESAFLNLPHRCEQATALEGTKVMAWTTAEIEDLILKRPRLSVALVQILVQRVPAKASRNDELPSWMALVVNEEPGTATIQACDPTTTIAIVFNFRGDRFHIVSFRNCHQ